LERNPFALGQAAITRLCQLHVAKSRREVVCQRCIVGNVSQEILPPDAVRIDVTAPAGNFLPIGEIINAEIAIGIEMSDKWCFSCRLNPAAVQTGEHAGIFVGTAVFMVAIVAALIISYLLTRRLPIMAIVSAIVVLVFGGATLFFQNEAFIKLKPTIIYLLFAGTLFGGLIFRKPLLAMVFDQMFHLTEEGWRKLTMRWALFFLALAVLNEIVWRTQSTDTWVTFKVFGVMPITFIFAALQYPLLMKHDATPKDETKS